MLPWDPIATQALEQAVNQAPVPTVLKSKVKKELKKAAETAAQAASHASVTPEDLMQGLLANMPAPMRDKIEAAMKQGPGGLKNLAKEFGGQKD